MTKELTIQAMPSESEFSMLQVVSRNAANCGLYGGVGSEQKIFMVLLAARELGIMPMQALNGGIWNIQGKIEISSRLMNAMIRRAGHSIKIVECNAQICVLEGTRSDNGDSFKSQFTIEDAKNAGLAGRSTWKSYAEDMLYSRAMSRLARRLFSDVIGTAYVEGEIRDAKGQNMIVEKVEVIVENSEEKQKLIEEFALQYPDESIDFIAEYLSGYAKHWKRSIKQTIDENHPEKFIVDFGNWVKKHKLTPMQIEEQADE